jgi:hypothetical protein
VSYLQTSTNNPYGHRPWATRLYTTFDDFAYLKQPQNLVIKGDQAMRPEIYRPPEMAGLGAVVTGSGRVIRRARRGMRGLGAIIQSDPFALAFPSIPKSQIIVRGPMFLGPPTPAPMPVRLPPIYACPAGLNAPCMGPGATSGGSVTPLVPPQPGPPFIYPPTIVPPVPQPVTSGPGGTVYALPGTLAVPGSPYMPAPPSELPAPGVPVTAAAGAAAAATPAPGSFSDWFNSSTWIAGIPNGYVALGGVAAIFLISRKGRR